MDRATYHREQADHFRNLAELTWEEGLETMLRDLGEQYDNMAASIERERGEPKSGDACRRSGRICEQQEDSTGNF